MEIAAIYNHYIVGSHCTFEKVPVSAAIMAERIATVQEKYPWLVIEENGTIKGYAYATAWKQREAYAQTVESTVYVHPDAFGQGYGRKLYSELVQQLKTGEFHAALGGIALPNDASIALHEKLGFRKVGQLQQVGFKFDRWIDVGYWELLLV